MDCLAYPISNGKFKNMSISSQPTRLSHLFQLKVECEPNYEVDNSPVNLTLNDKDKKWVMDKDPVCIDGVWTKNLACVPGN